MRIALVSAYDFAYPSGVNSHIYFLSQHLARMGNGVKILAPFTAGHVELPRNVIPIGGSFPFPFAGSISHWSPSPFLAKAVDAILARENFNIIHVHEPFAPMLPTTVVRRSNVPMVGTFHAYHGTPIAYRFFKPVLQPLARRLNGLTAVSKFAAQFVSQVFPGDYNIIPNGISFEHFSDQVKPFPELSDGKLNLLFVGRLEERKGLDHLLPAYALVKRKMPNIRLVVVGTGKAARHRHYAAMVEEWRLKDVVFVGYIPDADLPRYYRSAHVYCSPATGHESFGVVLLEAMAMGCPIVASNIPGYAGIITNGEEGILVPKRDIQALADALFMVLSDQSLRQNLAAQGRATASGYRWSRITKKVVDLYTEVLNGC
jgi:phosphatidyl-myo-inositol alpha-mannosyltransferase